MSLTTRVGLLAGASALSLAGVSLADTPQDYEARIAELEAKVSELGGTNWLTETRADEIRGLVQDVLADADTRASLLQGMGGGYDNGFVLGTSDGSFSLRLNGQLQARYNYNTQDMSPTDENVAGFENTRTKLMFSGNVGGPEWMYYVESNFGVSGGGFTLEDAWIGYDMGNDWVVKMGQFKTPHQREYLVHSSNQLAIERSLMGYQYASASRTQGLALDYQRDQWHFTGAFTDGAAAANTPFLMYDTEWAFTGRLEYLMSGNWGAFKDFTSGPGSEQGVLLGGAIHYQNDEYGTAAGPEVKRLLLTGDISIEMDGANVFAAINYQDNDSDGAGPDLSPLGFLIQGGMYFSDTMEGFIRYEFNDFDDAGEDLSLVTFGLNNYYNDHVKASIDLGFGVDPVRSSAAGPLTGWRDDAGTEDGQFLVRTQLQLTF